METLKQLVEAAIAICGGQSALAREITRRYDVQATQQNINHMLKGGPDKKTATRSSLTPYIAEIAGRSPTWSPKKPRGKGKATRKQPDPLRSARVVNVKISETGRIEKMEMTTEALRVAKAFMDMDADDRKQVIATVVSLEAKRKAQKGVVPDDEVHHLARPDTPEGQALRAKGKLKSTKHSN